MLLEEKVEIEFEKLPKDFVMLALIDTKYYRRISQSMVKFIIEKFGLSAIYISLNKPSKIIQKELQEQGIDTKRLYFIDASPHPEGLRPLRIDNCFYVRDPKNLTDLSIAINEIIHGVPDKIFIIVDSLTTLAIYNSSNSVVKFTHFLINRLRIWGIPGVFLSLEKGPSQKVESEIGQFCDKVITF